MSFVERRVIKTKYFIITVDTEGDNIWNWRPGAPIHVENANCVEKFQNLCEQYGMPPVYLVNYEMAQSDVLVNSLKSKASVGLCEIGMHLHAWNSPPAYHLPMTYKGNPYITEYPNEVIRDKHVLLKSIIEEQFEINPVSYRAGRWATNSELFRIIEDLGFKVDCSITPQISHTQLPGMSVESGPDYRKEIVQPHMLGKSLMEVPMTTRFVRSWNGRSIRNIVKSVIKGRTMWLRPAVQSVEEMIYLITRVEHEDVDNVEFMIHSSELMAGGSPYCKTQEDVELFYEKMRILFRHSIQNGYIGITLKEYYSSHIERFLRTVRPE